MTIARTSTNEHRNRAKRATNGQGTQPSEHPRKGGHDRRRRTWVSSQQCVHKCQGGSAITRPRCASLWRNPTASTCTQCPLLELEVHASAPEQGGRVVRAGAGHGHGVCEGGPQGGGRGQVAREPRTGAGMGLASGARRIGAVRGVNERDPGPQGRAGCGRGAARSRKSRFLAIWGPIGGGSGGAGLGGLGAGFWLESRRTCADPSRMLPKMILGLWG